MNLIILLVRIRRRLGEKIDGEMHMHYRYLITADNDDGENNSENSREAVLLSRGHSLTEDIVIAQLTARVID
jgi:hypothetical protein